MIRINIPFFEFVCLFNKPFVERVSCIFSLYVPQLTDEPRSIRI